MPLTQGQILNNRYRIARLLGQGGFGAVYKAWDLNFEVVCAIKENFETTVEAQRQFLREARLLHVLRHPNLPQVKDHFVIAGQGQYLVMDYVDGQDLEELRCAAGGRLPEAQVLSWGLQVCEALDYLHHQTPPVIHRDLKPANIKITPEGRAVLVDFGIAKTFDPLLKTTLGARAVTPGYSPIEQYGTGVTDARSDIYSLGATLYTLLTGRVPPEAPQRVLNDLLVPPRQLNPAISPAVEAALLQALQVHPEGRFQGVGEFWQVISDQFSVTGGQPPPARPFPWKWVGRGVGLLAGFVLLVVMVGLVAQGISASGPTQTAMVTITTRLSPTVSLPQRLSGTTTVSPGLIYTAAAQTADARLTELVALTPSVTLPSHPSATATPPPATTGVDVAAYVADITIPDNTDVAPGNTFVKTWRILNRGTSTWTTDYHLVFVSGEQMGTTTEVPVPASVAPGQQVDISVTMTAPITLGTYTGYWKLRNSTGTIFDYGVTVTIDVVR